MAGAVVEARPNLDFERVERVGDARIERGNRFALAAGDRQLAFVEFAVAVEDEADRKGFGVGLAEQLEMAAAVELTLVLHGLGDVLRKRGEHAGSVHARGGGTDGADRDSTLDAMRIDLHSHTAVFSTDSNLLPHDLITISAERGLDGVVLTEHDVVWPADRVAALNESSDILVLSGVEVTTELGHVLVYGLDALVPRITEARRLRALCDERGALMFLAHPARDPGLRVPPEAFRELFDGVEGLNGCDGPLQNQSASSRGRNLPLPPVGGSDCHALHEVGTAATEFEEEIGTMEDLVAALREGEYRPVALGY